MLLKRLAPLFFLCATAAACNKKTESTPRADVSKPATSATPNVAPAPGSQADALTLNADLGSVAIPEDNPQTDEKVVLGRQLFFDKRLSADGSRSCYSCHQNEDGNGGHEPIAIGANNKQLTRHSPVVWNVAYLSKFYWDGRSDSLEAQATAAWAGGNMGVGKDKLDAKAKEIGKIAGYKAGFEAAFPGKGVTPETIVQAISAYERTLICDDTAFDRYAKGRKSALNQAQKHGLELFMNKAGCVACHTPPHFTIAAMTKEGAYFNTGVGVEGKPEASVDVGRMSVTKKDVDFAAFKPPTLRNVSKSAPYFHDGSGKTLEDAVRFMASGGFKNKNITPILTDKKLSDEEINALVAFLGALDCNKTLDEPKLP
jgi:cytochrome c peroxidase